MPWFAMRTLTGFSNQASRHCPNDEACSQKSCLLLAQSASDTAANHLFTLSSQNKGDDLCLRYTGRGLEYDLWTEISHVCISSPDFYPRQPQTSISKCPPGISSRDAVTSPNSRALTELATFSPNLIFFLCSLSWLVVWPSHHITLSKPRGILLC